MDNSTALKPLVVSELSPPLKYHYITDEQGLVGLQDYFKRVSVFTIDTETQVTKTFVPRRIRTIQLGDKNEAYVIDLLPFAQRAGFNLAAPISDYRAFDGFSEIVSVLRPVLESKQWLKVGHNLQFDYEMLKWCLGIRMWNLYDTLLAEKVLYAGLRSFDIKGFWALDDLVARYAGLQIDKSNQTSFDLESPITEDQLVYCALDCRLPMAIKGAQYDKLNKANLLYTCQIEFDAIPAFGDMKLNGLKLDKDKWMAEVNKVKADHLKNVAKLDQWLLPIVGSKTLPNYDLDALEHIWKTTTDKEARANARKEFMACRKNLRICRENMDSYEGDSAINYGSNTQLLAALRKLGFSAKVLPDTNDRTLKMCAENPKLDMKGLKKTDPEYKKVGLIDVIRLYRETKKVLTTYGEGFIRDYIDPDTGLIHASIIQLAAETGRTSSRNPNCFSEDTEVLTKRGWLLFSALKEDDLVAQYDLNNKEISFALPEGYVNRRHVGYLLSICTEEQIDLLMTEDHSCLLQDRKTRQFIKVTANKYRSDYRQIGAGIYAGGNISVSTSKLTVIAALQADGHIRKDGYGIEFVFNKLRKSERLEDALIASGVSYTKRPKGKGYRFYISQVPDWLQDKKFFSGWILDLDRESFNFLAEEIWFWDGCLARRSMFSSNIKTNTDWAQILTVLTGRRGKVRAYKMPSGNLNWQVDASSNDYSLTTNHTSTKVKYSGKVYCVKMPKGTVIVRRNGKVAVTGQCQNIPKGSDWRACFVARPGYKLITMDYNGCELRILAEYSREKVFIEAFLKGWDVHSVGAEIIFEDEWKNAAVQEPYKVTKDNKEEWIPACAYYFKENNSLNKKGEVVSTGRDHEKCFCPKHKELRDQIKSVNFGIAYGMEAKKLSEAVGCTEEEAQKLLDKYRKAFPRLIAYLSESGKFAVTKMESRTLAQRRRLFHKPTWADATVMATRRMLEKAKRSGLSTINLIPTTRQISSAYKGMYSAIEREGKNTPIQGSNADLAKIACGCGFDKMGMGFMWHQLPKYNALLVGFVHDEFLVEVPEGDQEMECFNAVGDSMQRGGGELVSVVPMITEGHIGYQWQK
jgi:DNA polymerase I-like protein with 3'-5' exonuclease and polymerase domains